MSRTHKLKTWPEPFSAVEAGRKRYEIRTDDRGYAVGDWLLLCEWDPTTHDEIWRKYEARGFTGREVLVRVTYMTPGGAWGLPEKLCVMSIERAHHENEGGGGT